MARILLFALLGAAAWYGWQAFRRNQVRVGEALRRAEGSLAKNEPVNLEKDPKTGVYRPIDRD